MIDPRDVRLRRQGREYWECAGRKQQHVWIPISFVFESQLLDDGGRVIVRQPDTENGRVYCVCMGCHSHTYIVTQWYGAYIQSPEVDMHQDETGEADAQDGAGEAAVDVRTHAAMAWVPPVRAHPEREVDADHADSDRRR